MRRLILKMSMSVDGFVGSVDGNIDWIFKSTDDVATNWILDLLRDTGLHIMGSRTFQDMAAFWPTSTEPFAAPMNAIPKVVFSRKAHIDLDRKETTTALVDASRRRLAEGGGALPDEPSNLGNWRNAPVASGDLAEEVARLKQMPGKDILAHGGAGFAQSLAERNLIDEYRLLVHPVVLGRGLSLFGAVPEPRKLRLVSATAFPAGAIAQVYRPR
jgi:dihydrofolate reductase